MAAMRTTDYRLRVRLVAFERPDGVLVARLLDAGLRVLAMYPNQVAAARARFRVCGGKSDRFDAFVLASSRAQVIIASGCSRPTARRPRRCGR
jgi:predicted aminopeptidase